MRPIFVIILRYLKAPEIIDTVRTEHRLFLDEQYKNGIFIASGIQTPGNGGVILAKDIEREALNTLLHQDPFYQHQYAEYQIFEFTPTKYTEDFKNILIA